jgi:hypothetical protein
LEVPPTHGIQENKTSISLRAQNIHDVFE